MGLCPNFWTDSSLSAAMEAVLGTIMKEYMSQTEAVMKQHLANSYCLPSNNYPGIRCWQRVRGRRASENERARTGEEMEPQRARGCAKQWKQRAARAREC